MQRLFAPKMKTRRLEPLSPKEDKATIIKIYINNSAIQDNDQQQEQQQKAEQKNVPEPGCFSRLCGC